MCVLESLACGTPVVSFNCESGPSEMIKQGENGLLVKNQDFDDLTLKMNTFVQENTLYVRCKTNAVASVDKFEDGHIKAKWLKLLE